MPQKITPSAGYGNVADSAIDNTQSASLSPPLTSKVQALKRQLEGSWLSGLLGMKPPAWQPKDRYILSSDSVKAINSLAQVNAIHRCIPNSHRFRINTPQGYAEKIPEQRKFGPELSSQDQQLQYLNLNSRLDIHGHGWTEIFENLSAQKLAKRLHRAGLTEVGVIKLHSCGIGKERFLEDLKVELSNLGVKVGYISGPTDVAGDSRIPVTLFGHHCVIKTIPFLPKKVVGNIYTPEKFGLRVVKGNTHVTFPRTRYNLPADRDYFIEKLRSDSDDSDSLQGELTTEGHF